MIVQRVPAGEPTIIIRNVDHAVTAGQLARAFGNAQFLVPEPMELMTYVVEHHEEGWRPLDEAPRRNPLTGLPYHLGETPADLLIQKSVASPNWNERRHPWCGLLSSMHSWGLYNGRYGISDAITIEARPPAHAAQIEAMLEGELARQARLKEVLRADWSTASWVEKEVLLSSYKLLEFFDTLALWFQLTHAALREPARFRVPAAEGEDLILTIEPTGQDTARISPFPFRESPIRLRCLVRAITPSEGDAEFASAMAEAVPFWQSFVLTA